MSNLGSRHTHISVKESESVPRSGSARVGVAWHLPEVLREFGVDVDEVLAAAAVRRDIFDDRENRIGPLEFERLLLECERRTNCEHIGLLAAQRTRLADMGLAGQMALCGTTAEEGLRSFVGHFNLHSSASTVSVIKFGGFARVVYAIAGRGMNDTRHFQVGGVTFGFNILQELCGPNWLPSVVTFASRAPSNLRPFQRFFRAPLRFDSDESALIFEQRWLERPLPPVDPLFRQQVETAVRAQRAAIVADFPATVRRILRKQLVLGDCSMDDVAALLGMHRRTLDRHLHRHGVRYGELAASVKDDAAHQLLLDTDLKVQQVAESLRFSSAANFATAFRRWTGVTPSEFRRRAG